MTRYTASHARAAAWVLVATLLFGWAVAGCDDRPADVAACFEKCKAAGGEMGRTGLGGIQQEFFTNRAVSCLCSFPMPFADAGAK
jgi:hypothetical protein